MARLQLIFVIETSSDDKSDSLYLRTILDYYFVFESNQYDGEVAIQTIYLNGKQHYKDKKVVNQINNQAKMFLSQNPDSVTRVIFIIDTDSTEKEYRIGSFFSNVTNFCREHDYELAWYCKNAENVFLGKDPSSINNKTEAAISFVKNSSIKRLDKNKLTKRVVEYRCSNILNVIGKYLKSK